MSRNISILHLLPSVGPGSFGVGIVALNLAREQLALGHHVEIWCVDTEEDVEWATQTAALSKDVIKSFPCLGPKHIAFSPQMEKAMRLLYPDSFDVVHQHGIWTATSRVTCSWRKRTGKPSVVAPHGTLQRWALNKSKYKKKLALLAYEWRNLTSASCLHALAQSEKDDCRQFGLHNQLAVIPNGICQTWLDAVGNRNGFLGKYGISTDKHIALFLSRITPKKGLPMLFRAMHSMKGKLQDWVFLIAGVDEYNHQIECERIVKDYCLGDIVKFIGPLYGDDKRDGFTAADLFILPSYSEGAPIVILEALGAGIPVLTTIASPWKELETRKCGWWTDISVEAIGTALEDAICKKREELGALGANGCSLVQEKYTWFKSAQMTIELYEWLLERKKKPKLVDLC